MPTVNRTGVDAGSRPIEAARERLLYGVYLQLLLAGDGA
jgi:hypothetical protein